MMQGLATSDLHGNLPKIPPCDLLLIGGDICPDYGANDQLAWLDGPFRNWLSEIHQHVKQIVAIAGNHDFVFEKMPMAISELHLPWTYLQDSVTAVEGLKIYGIPWVPNLPSWAFYAPKEALHERYLAIPKDTDIVLSHGPPHNYGDRIRSMFIKPHEATPHVGSKSAVDMMNRVKPQILICGHIHEGFGYYVHKHADHHVQIYNVSYVDEYYAPRGQIIEIDLGERVMVDAQQEQKESDSSLSAVCSASART